MPIFKKEKKDKFKVEWTGRHREYDLDEEARLFREWADQEENMAYRMFAAVRAYSSQSKLHEYADMCPAFREAFEYAKTVIGTRREYMIQKGKGHPAPFMRYAAVYDEDLKKHEKEMKQEENAFSGTFKVEITDFKNAS